MSVYDYLINGIPYDERYYLQGSEDVPEKFAKGGVASRDDDYIFNRHGKFTGEVRSRPGQPHRLGMPDKDGKMQYYTFADQVNDPKNVSEWHSKAIPVSKREIVSQLANKGALNDTNRNKIGKKFWFGINSLRNENFDYTTQYLIPKYGEDLGGVDYRDSGQVDYEGEPIYEPYYNKVKYSDNVFFLPEGNGYAHNTFNFGNFLWGATGRALGISESQLKAGANLHNKYNINSGDFGNDDSPDDQFSISQGVKFSEINNLPNITWNDKIKKFIKSKPTSSKVEFPKYGQPKY